MFSLKMVIFPKSTSWKSYVPIVANCKDFYVSQCFETYEFFLEGYKIHLDFTYLWVASIVMCPQFWGNLDPSCSNDKQFARCLVIENEVTELFKTYHTTFSCLIFKC